MRSSPALTRSSRFFTTSSTFFVSVLSSPGMSAAKAMPAARNAQSSARVVRILSPASEVRTVYDAGSMTISHRGALRYMAVLAAIGLLHHTDHVLRYDHSGWPFRPEVTPFTFSLLVYPVIASMLLFENRTY